MSTLVRNERAKGGQTAPAPGPDATRTLTTASLDTLGQCWYGADLTASTIDQPGADRDLASSRARRDQQGEPSPTRPDPPRSPLSLAQQLQTIRASQTEIASLMGALADALRRQERLLEAIQQAHPANLASEERTAAPALPVAPCPALPAAPGPAIPRPANGGSAGELLTTAEVAALLRVSRATVYDWAAKGKIPCCRPNGRLRFDRAALEAWLASEARPDIAREDDHDSDQVSRRVVRRRMGERAGPGQTPHEATQPHADQEGHRSVRAPARRGRLIDLDAIPRKDVR